MRKIITEAVFHPMGDGQRFFILHRPSNSTPARGALLHIHAFAEEMNKSRRAVSLAARLLAARGWWVLQHDLLGCGDSSGDFGDATWSAWIQDIDIAFHWLAKRSGSTPTLWGLRTGCLLAIQATEILACKPNLLLWQPVISGRTFLQQFLRLKVAGKVLSEGGQSVSTKELLQTLRSGSSLNVAGYQLSADLALPLEQAEAHLAASRAGKILLCELAMAPGAKGLSPSLTRMADEWRDGGCSISWECVSDLPFWQTQEIAEGQGFRTSTLQLLDQLIE